MKNRNTVILFIILIIGIVLRLYNPCFRSLWGDEAHSVFSAMNFSLVGLLKDSHFPLYFILLGAWVKFAGLSELALRVFSIIIGIISLAVFIRMAKNWFDEETAVLAALFMAISPLAVMHSQEIRMYGLLMLLAMLSCWSFWKLVNKNTKLNAVFYLVSTAGLLTTHIFAGLIFLCQVVYIFLYHRKQISLLFLQAFIAAVVFPLFIKILQQNLMAAVAGSIDMAFAVFPGYLKLMLIYFVLTFGETMAPWNFIWVIPGGLTVVIALVLSLKNIWRKELIPYLWLLVLLPPLVAAFIVKPTMPKYLIVCLPFFLLLLAIGLANISNRVLRYLLLMILIVCQLMSIRNYFSLQEYHNSNQIEPWRKIAEQINKKHLAADIILCSNHFVCHHLLDYSLNLAGHNQITIYDLENDKIFALPSKPNRIWFITNIHDDRQFLPGYIEGVKQKMGKSYKLVSIDKYVSYDETLVAKLPIKRHEKGVYRIVVSLYQKR